MLHQFGDASPQSLLALDGKASHLLVHVLTEVHVLSQALAAVFQVHAQQHLVCQLLLGLSQAVVQLNTHRESKR